jgi:hypothetical protein
VSAICSVVEFGNVKTALAVCPVGDGMSTA